MDSSRGRLRNQVVSFLVWLWCYWLGKAWIWFWDSFDGFTIVMFCLENRVCLSLGVYVTGATWCAVIRIMTVVGDLVQRTGDGHTGRVIERSGGPVCSLHHASGEEKHEFLGWASKPRSMVCHWFDLKPLERFLPILPQNRWRRFSWFGIKTMGDVFLFSASKPSRLRFVGCTRKLMERGQRRTRVEIWWLALPGSKSR
jgi:hypothetical protein